MGSTSSFPSPAQVGLSGGQSERATADDLTSGYDAVTPPAPSPALFPANPDPSLAGPGGFNQANGSVAQNILTDPNLAPVLASPSPRTTFGPADFSQLPGADGALNTITDPNVAGVRTPSLNTYGPDAAPPAVASAETPL